MAMAESDKMSHPSDSDVEDDDDDDLKSSCCCDEDAEGTCAHCQQRFGSRDEDSCCSWFKLIGHLQPVLSSRLKLRFE